MRKSFNIEDVQNLRNRYIENLQNYLENPEGPGTELKALLAKVGIVPTPSCKCNERAAIMDQNGSEWTEQNIDRVVGWLKEESDKRNLPFVPIAAKLLVKRAIHNARKKENQKTLVQKIKEEPEQKPKEKSKFWKFF
jgi:hypothetical protein